MSDSINLMIRDDGVATIYDDTYDITIHCENEEEQHKVVELLKSIPSVQPERKRGEWIKWDFKTFGAFGDWEYKCSNCEKVYGGEYNFCPNCGADMRGKNDGSDSQG